jgi:hypothetical protein
MPAQGNESARRAARRDEVFGVVFADRVGGEREPESGDDVDDEDRYLRERPPHHEGPA